MSHRSRKTLSSALWITTVIAAFFSLNHAFAEMRFIQVAAQNKQARSQIADAGMSIEAVRSDSVWGFAQPEEIAALRARGFKILGNFPRETARGGHQGMFGFPIADERFHTYAEVQGALRNLQSKNADIARVISIGKTVEGRDIWALHINTDPESLQNSQSRKPGVIFMGNHHAREHLSAEIPLMLAEHLLANRRIESLAATLDSRDIWIIPMVNPDGAEFDISSNNYKYWRKNRSVNAGGTYGVDLNRNYGYGWGTGGSSSSPSSDVYMGPAPFSEPETRAIRDFVISQANTTVLLTFHTYSELILYPWGGKYDPVANATDHAAFKKMAETMAAWNQYTPEQASELYIASGDTVDWAYGERGIFGFTFELSPSSTGGGGFYPGAGVIDRVFNDNLKPCLYLLDVAADPRAVVGTQPSGWLKSYVAPQTPASAFYGLRPY